MSAKGKPQADQDLFIALDPAIETALEAGGVGIWRWKVGSTELGWTRNLEAIHRLAPGTFDGTFESFSADIDQGDLERVMKTIQEAVEKGGAYEIRYRNRAAAAGESIWIEARGQIVQAGDGQRYMTGICQNATERINAQMQLERRLAQQQAVSALGTYALGEEDLGKVLARAVEVSAEVLSVPMAKILELSPNADSVRLVAGVGWKPGLVGTAKVGVDSDSQAGYTLSSASPVIVEDLATETRFSGPPLLHEHGVRSGMSVVIAGYEGRPYGVFGVHTAEPRVFDRSDTDFLQSLSNIVANSVRLARISDRRRLIIREMAHRSGNLFQLVQSLFNQSMGADREDAAAQRFRSRLDALASTNFLIAQDGWSQSRMVEVARTALGGFAPNVDVTGRDILLPADLAFDLALVLHEVATNSAKYGSLAKDSGRTRLEWRVAQEADDAELALEWVDENPAAKAGPGPGTGFGRRLISALVEKKWSGRITTERENGFRLTCRIPLPRPAGGETG